MIIVINFDLNNNLIEDSKNIIIFCAQIFFYVCIIYIQYT